MAEKPILFNGEMIRAILNGTKTQTRRVIKPQPDMSKMRWNGEAWEMHMGYPHGHDAPISPYGRVGDFLWVREAWKPGAWRDDGRIAIDYKASPELTNTSWLGIPDDDDGEKFNELWMKWTDELIAKRAECDSSGVYYWEPGQSPLRWRPSIHMPRWASRIDLKVTAVRLEQLQDISVEDIRAEGVYAGMQAAAENWKAAWIKDDGYQLYKDFEWLWDSINAKRGYSWKSNPWVWVVGFSLLGRNDAQRSSQARSSVA